MYIGHDLYVYGGWDGKDAYNTLHRLNVNTLTWTEMERGDINELPMKMSGCGLVAFGKDKLVLFGGYGQPSTTNASNTSTKSKSKRNLVTTSKLVPRKSASSRSTTHSESPAQTLSQSTTNSQSIKSQASVDNEDGITKIDGDLDSEGRDALSGIKENGVEEEKDKEGGDLVLTNVNAGSVNPLSNGEAKEEKKEEGKEDLVVANTSAVASAENESPVENGFDKPEDGTKVIQNDSAASAVEDEGGQDEGGLTGPGASPNTNGGIISPEGDSGVASPVANGEEASPKRATVKFFENGETEPMKIDLSLAEPIGLPQSNSIDLSLADASSKEEEDEVEKEVLAVVDKQWTNELKVYDLQTRKWKEHTYIYVCMYIVDFLCV